MLDRTSIVFVRNIMSSWVSRLAAMLASFLVTPVLIHGLGSQGYGLWAVALTLTSYLALVDVGVTGGLVRAISVANAQRNQRRIAGYVASAFAFYAVVGVVLIAVIFVLHQRIAALFGVPHAFLASTGTILVGVTAVLVISNLTATFNQVFTALERIHLTGVITVLISVLNAIGFVFALDVFHAGISGLVISNVITSSIVMVVSGVLAKSTCHAVSINPKHVSWPAFAEVATLSLAIQLSNIAGAVNVSVDKLLLAGFVGLTSAGIYDLGSRLTLVIWMLSWLVAGAAYPAVSRLSQEAPEMIRTFYVRAERYLQMTSCGLAGGLIVVAPWLIPLWLGPGYHRVILVTQVLAVSSAGLGFTQVAKVTLWGLKQVKEMIIFEVSRLSMHVVLSLILIWRIGFNGALIGALIAITLPSVWLVWIAHRRLGVSNITWLRGAIIGPVTASIVCAAGTWLLFTDVVAPDIGDSSRLSLVLLVFLAGSTYSLAYLAFLFRLRVFEKDDLATMRHGRMLLWGRVRGLLGAQT